MRSTVVEMGLGIHLICFWFLQMLSAFFYSRGQTLSVRMGRVTGALKVHLFCYSLRWWEVQALQCHDVWSRFPLSVGSSMGSYKGHQLSFHTPFLNHSIVFWDKIKGRTLALPDVCWSTRTAVYFQCPPPLLFCSVISLILFKWCCYLCLPAKDEMAKLPHLLDCGLQILLC